MGKNVIKQISAITIATLFAGAAAAQESKQEINPLGIEWHGSLDFYFQTSPQAHRPLPATPAGPQALEGRSFDRHVNQMTLNMAEISLTKKQGKTTFRTDIALGEMVDQLSGGGSQSATGAGAGQNPTNVAANEPTRHLLQATVSYAATDRFTFSAGKFYTHMGLEVAKAKDNAQYSRSYTFNYGIPFSHQGISGTYAVDPGKLNATFYFLNAWDSRLSQEQNQGATLGANLNFLGFENLIVNYNYLGGGENNSQSLREVHEINASYKFNPMISVAVDYILGSQNNIPAIGTAKWSGLAFYVKAHFSDLYSVSTRYETFDDSDQGFAIAGGLSSPGTKQTLNSLTLSNNFNLGDGLELRLELRSDKSDSSLFFKDSDDNETSGQDSGTVAFLYSF